MTGFRSVTGKYSRYRIKTNVAALISTIVAAENTATLDHANTLAPKMATSGISRDCDVKRTMASIGAANHRQLAAKRKDSSAAQRDQRAGLRPFLLVYTRSNVAQHRRERKS